LPRYRLPEVYRTHIVFKKEVVRPFPKGRPRKISNRGKMRRKATPFKKNKRATEEERMDLQSNKNEKTRGMKGSLNSLKSVKVDESYWCFVCGED
jgi:hypothetical protein